MGVFPRDSQRQRLYDAEASINPGHGFASLATVQAYVDRILATAWWQTCFPTVQRVVIDPGSRRKWAGAWKTKEGGTIYLPPGTQGPLSVLHELAHLAQPRRSAFHGPEFAGIYLALVRNRMGWRKERSLAAAFKRHRVRVQALLRTSGHHYYLNEPGGTDDLAWFYELCAALRDQDLERAPGEGAP
jgi:putative metallohydrolase (TIGR04338 family)